MPRFMSLIRVDESTAPPEGPSEALLERMDALIKEMTKAGVMLDTAGLTPAAQGARVHWEGGRLSVTDGPFTESKELVGGYAIVQAKDRAEAIEWTKRFVQVHEDYYTLTCEVREIVEG